MRVTRSSNVELDVYDASTSSQLQLVSPLHATQSAGNRSCHKLSKRSLAVIAALPTFGSSPALNVFILRNSCLTSAFPAHCDNFGAGLCDRSRREDPCPPMLQHSVRVETSVAYCDAA